MSTPWKSMLLGAVLVTLGSLASAEIVYGRFNDPINIALVGSDLGSPGFADDGAVANNVALYGFTVPMAGRVTIQSTGFVAGGVDPYFSLFLGSGASATFVDSNYVQAFSTGGDFLYSALLEAGAYQIALGSFANLSFAENSGGGALGDGFVALGEPGSLGDSSYRLVLTMPSATQSVPEPSALWLFSIGLIAFGIPQRTRHRQLTI